MIGKIHCSLGDVLSLSLSSQQCHQLLLSNQWLNRVKNTKKGQREKKFNSQKKGDLICKLLNVDTELRRFRTKTCSCEEQKRGLTGKRKEKMGPYRLLHSGATKKLVRIWIS